MNTAKYLPDRTSRIVIRLAGAPVAKGRGRVGTAGHGVRGRPVVFTPAKTRTYEAVLRYMASDVMGVRAPITRAVHVTIVAKFPIPPSWSKKKRALAAAQEIPMVTRPDIENVAKIALDAMNGIVYVDDRQVTALSINKMYHEKPELVIVVSEPERSLT